MTAAPAEAPRWPELQRSRRAIVVVDMVESVRLMQRYEVDVVERWRAFVLDIQTAVLPVRGGRMVKSLGDGMLLEFEWAPSAAGAAIDIQRRAAGMNVGQPESAHILLRVGIHVDDILVDALDIFGSGVNLTARLASLARPGEIVVSSQLRDLLVEGVDPAIEDLGERFVKHLDEPLRVFRLGVASSPRDLGPPDSLDVSRPGIAVMPFECSIGNDTDDIFGEALSDEIISHLARCAELHIISGLSSRSLRRRRLSVPDIGNMLGAQFVLSGRYRIDVDAIVLQVELADVRSAEIVWSDRFQTSFRSAFSIDSTLVDEVVSAVGQAILASALRRADQEPLQSLEGYALLLASVSLMHRNSLPAFLRARALLEHLAERQGRRGLVQAWLAKWHVLKTVQGWAEDPSQESAAAMIRVQNALDVNPSNGLALAIGGLVYGYLRKDLNTAGTYYEQALAANPNESLAWLFTSVREAYLGRGEQAEFAAEKSLRLSPLDPMRYFFDSLASTAVLANGKVERSIDLARRSLRVNRSHASTWRTLIHALQLQGSGDDARDAARELLRIEPNLTVAGFLRRFPGSEGPMGAPWAASLEAAGIPR